jgi:hypothetical protein
MFSISSGIIVAPGQPKKRKRPEVPSFLFALIAADRENILKELK